MSKKLCLFVFCSLLFGTFILSYASNVGEEDTDASLVVKSFYQSYITNISDFNKTDSVLSLYCTNDLKDFVLESLYEDDYDFILDGWGGSEISPDSVIVIQLNERYKVSFKASQYLNEELATVVLYVMVNQYNKISCIIRPSDNYIIPHPLL